MDKEKSIFGKSEKFKDEYSCRVLRIGEVFPIEKSDFLGKTLVGGETIVVRKDEVREGDVFLYACKENVLPEEFLSRNDLFMFDLRQRNENYPVCQKLVDESERLKDSDPEKSAALLERAKRMSGYFGDKCRVRIATLRGVASAGFLFGVRELVKWRPALKKYFEQHRLEEFVGTFFDTVDGELFCYPYVPKPAVRKIPKAGKKRKRRKEERFDRVIPGEFQFHYDTQKLGDNVWRLKPDTVVAISVKEHGTSAIISNVKTNVPIPLPFYKRWWNSLTRRIPALRKWKITDSYVDYGILYSSRTVIKNGYLYGSKHRHLDYYGEDVWREYGELLKDVVPKGWTIYGEIVGYLTKSSKFIQKNYDYGCAPGTNKLMPYRITHEEPDGTKKEWNVEDVKKWTETTMKKHPELADRLQPICVLYHGTLRDLYPDLDESSHWNENLLIRLKQDKEWFGMEMNEPLCKNKVPREGIVLRIDDDPNKEAFKLKTDKFALREAKQMDAGDVSDIEMQNSDYQDGGERDA